MVLRVRPKVRGGCLPTSQLCFLCELFLGQPNACRLPLGPHPALRSTAAFHVVPVNGVLAIAFPPRVLGAAWLAGSWASVLGLECIGSGCHGRWVLREVLAGAEGPPGLSRGTTTAARAPEPGQTP